MLQLFIHSVQREGIDSSLPANFPLKQPRRAHDEPVELNQEEAAAGGSQEFAESAFPTDCLPHSFKPLNQKHHIHPAGRDRKRGEKLSLHHYSL